MYSTLQQLKNGEYKGAISLKLSEQLTQFPEEIFGLADTLEVLDLSGNCLSSLLLHFGCLQKLRILFLSDNLFTELPAVLGDCPLLDIVGFKANRIALINPASLNRNLRWLILTNNRIEKIPSQIGACSRMQKLMLAGNRLKELPHELASCSKLSLLRISANCLEVLPSWLLSMPTLAWLAFAGNPFVKNPPVEILPAISWNDLDLKQLLGEGASGVISSAEWNSGTEIKEVAVKIFKGAVTSDGLPEDEMNTCITAGLHPGLVKMIGQIAGHPEHKKGLVMDLIPERYFNLGITPSFESCTRDQFKEGFTISENQAVNIACTIGSLAAQLHSKGILHGDMYAHNILIDGTGNTLFGDFGAASFYNREDVALATLLERIEVRAYGYLLDDLLSLTINLQRSPTLKKMAKIRDMCLADDVLVRPGFHDLTDEWGM